MVIRPSTSHHNFNPRCTEPLSIDFRETAPSGSTPHMFSPRPDDPTFDSARASRIGGLAVGVPGELRGLEAAYKACGGGLPWARLVQPSADLARESIIGIELARRLSIPFLSGWMLKEKMWSDIFVKDGRMRKAGETLRRETYARTLETIGREGAGAFYEVSLGSFSLAERANDKLFRVPSPTPSFARSRRLAGSSPLMTSLPTSPSSSPPCERRTATVPTTLATLPLEDPFSSVSSTRLRRTPTLCVAGRRDLRCTDLSSRSSVSLLLASVWCAR